MDETRSFQFIADEFAKKKIPFLLIGGYALKKYGSPRFTADIDLLVNQTQYPEVKLILEKGGYREEVIGQIFARFSEIHGAPMTVDFLFVEKTTFQELLKSGKPLQWADRTFVVPSPMHLIALKLHALKNGGSHREAKDLLDIIQIIHFETIDIEAESFQKLCSQYGPQNIFEKIKVLAGGS